MVTLETVLDVVPVVSLAIALTYYAINIRNQNRTRQAQLLMGLYETYRSPEFRMQQLTISNLEYTDYNDFWTRYGGETNPESWAMWLSVAGFFNGIGVLLKRNLIDIALVEELLSNITNRSWTLMGPILKEWRRENTPQIKRKYELMHGFEYLYEQMKSRGTI